MEKQKNYKKTLVACYLGFVTQAITANFTPLLFLTFKNTYGIGFEKIALIPMAFYFTQLLIDFAAAKFVDKIGYRVCVVSSQVLSAAGLVLMAVLPELFPVPFAGILIAVVLYAIGSGLVEVLVSPIVEACPFENKGGMISRGFSQDVVVGAINSAMNQLEKEKEAEAESEDVGSIESAANEAEKTEKATSFYSTQDVIKSLESGNTQSAQKAVLDIYNTKVENKIAEGKTKKEADKSARSSIKSALTSEYKARYVNGTAAERSKIQKMLKSIYINGKPLYENKDFSSWLKD